MALLTKFVLNLHINFVLITTCIKKMFNKLGVYTKSINKYNEINKFIESLYHLVKLNWININMLKYRVATLSN